LSYKLSERKKTGHTYSETPQPQLLTLKTANESGYDLLKMFFMKTQISTFDNLSMSLSIFSFKNYLKTNKTYVD
jgi:hypothetical protein